MVHGTKGGFKTEEVDLVQDRDGTDEGTSEELHTTEADEGVRPSKRRVTLVSVGLRILPLYGWYTGKAVVEGSQILSWS